MSKDSKYPWIKRIFKKDEPAKCVYAGPEMMDRLSRGDVDPDEANANPASGVYAGPEAFGILTGRVYAGPEPPPEPMPTYAGPAPQSDGFDFGDDGEMNDVYAGPEFFERSPDGDPVDQVEETEKVEEIEEAEEPVVYAPRDDAPPFDDPAMFMCVYAGPEFFNRDPNAAPAGIFAPPIDEDSPRLRICPKCLRDIPEDSKFCPECGAVLANGAEPRPLADGERQCPTCGAIFATDGKFCPECGTIMPPPRSDKKIDVALWTYCVDCGAPYGEGADHCPECCSKRGFSDPNDTLVLCLDCGGWYPSTAKFCPFCAVDVRDQHKR